MTAARRRFLVNGIVQGVGFRPFVFNLAETLRLTGFVTNTSAGVVIEIQGAPRALDDFASRLTAEAPPLARIVSVEAEDMAPRAGAGVFAIRPSRNAPGTSTFIPPDVATCTDCLREILDPHNRRHAYPFTNCTNCGPRWTIIRRIPYDRPYTSMAPFCMCPDCLAEYENPRDRRFHAQPNACRACGPRVWLEDETGPVDGDPLAGAAQLLAAGRILAIKGLGGFHLAVRADRQDAVERLRRRKGREAKPLAVMTADLAEAHRLGIISGAEIDLLCSPQAPIVLLEKQGSAPVCPAVATGHRRLGVMLPYTPLHHLLFAALKNPGIRTLVMTSGNPGSDPICLDNDGARNHLGGIADALLLHDRDIVRRADDSVLQVLPLEAEPVMFRRGRGYAPVPLILGGVKTGPEILAVGPELKNTVCVLKENRGFISPHIGDLENLQTNRFFTETIATLTDLLECRPRVIAHDLHPGYFSTRWARQSAAQDPVIKLVPVQHHHAHLAAVLAEHGHRGPALGLILDGTGYGTDGTVWGGELLLGDTAHFRRVGHLETVALPGGEAAIKQPWRTAVSYLRTAFGPDSAVWPALPFLAEHPVQPVLEILAKNLNCPLTSSCGRLFDAVAALCGHWATAHYEAQAAMEFMALTNPDEVNAAEAFPLKMEVPADGIIPVTPLVRACATAIAGGAPCAVVSARFHRTLIELLASATASAATRAGVATVVLAGGVMQNEILLAGLMQALGRAGYQVLRHRELPPGDGAIALGQAVIARATLD